MSVANLQMQYAIRSQLLTMEAATTGSASLAATASGFTRTTGSFITDGFEPGMEVLAASFGSVGNNTYWPVTQVEALTLAVSGLTTESAGSGRTISAGLPSTRGWENIKITPTSGAAFIEEDYLSGPQQQLSVGTTNATVVVDPMYVVRIFVPEDYGVGAANRYADAVLAVFTPNSSMTLTNGDVLKVRTDTAPFRGQLIRQRAGWVTMPVTIPFRLYTTNS